MLWLSVCLGINDIRQMDIFRILSGILHMGNVVIEKDERAIDKCHIAVSNSECTEDFVVLFLPCDCM